ncbi:MAG: ABC transporter permease [Ktedonobacterales bacterium]
MIVKELRTARWALLAGLAIILQRVIDLASTNLHAQTLESLQNATDADFSLVMHGHLSAAAAYVWGVFFADVSLYLLVGIGGALFGAGLIASEVSSGTILTLLSRPMSRERALLTKYGIAAGLLLVLCVLCGVLALALGARQGVEQPPLGGVAASVLLLWLGTLFVLGLTLVYSVLIPSALAAGFLGFFTTYVLSIAPLFHDATTHRYYLGGPDWSIANYWGSLGVYAGVDSPAKALLIAVVAAVVPPLLALLVFRRKAF